jgi:hypothetical protein
MKELFSFNKMLTPKLMTLIYRAYLIFVLFSVVFGLFVSDMETYFYGASLSLVGIVVVRMVMECFIVIFTINENIRKLAEISED